MRKFFTLLFAATALIAAEPSRESGLSVHMLPDRVAQLRGGHGGFSVTEPGTGAKGSTFADANGLLAYFLSLPAAVQASGVWIVTTHPTSYSEPEHDQLKTLIALCAGKNIPLFTCRGSELPNGWTRAK